MSLPILSERSKRFERAARREMATAFPNATCDLALSGSLIVRLTVRWPEPRQPATYDVTLQLIEMASTSPEDLAAMAVRSLCHAPAA